MIENLIKSALSSQGGSLLSSLGLDADKQQPAMDLAKDSVLDGLKSTALSGGISSITSAISGGSGSLVESITSNYGASLISKLGVNEGLAKTISTSLIPMIFNFIKKDKTPTDSDSDVQGMLGSLIGGGTDGMMDNVGGFLKDKLNF